MRQIIVDIEAGEVRCDGCMSREGRHCAQYYGLVIPFDEDGYFMRLPSCLEAEAELTRLVEAAEGITNWFNGRSPGFRERCSIEKFKELAAALKEVKGE
jgi:hypothetical protein